MSRYEPKIISHHPFVLRFPCTMNQWYEVRETKKKFYGIYYHDCGGEKFITHRENRNNACSVALLMQGAFLNGVESQRGDDGYR